MSRRSLLKWQKAVDQALDVGDSSQFKELLEEGTAIVLQVERDAKALFEAERALAAARARYVKYPLSPLDAVGTVKPESASMADSS